MDGAQLAVGDSGRARYELGVHACVLSHSVVSDPVRPHGL